MTQCVTKWTKCMCMKESTFLGLGSLLYLRSSLLVLHIIINKLTTKEKQRDLLCSCLTITPLDWYIEGGLMISIGEATRLPPGQHLTIRARSDLV